MQKIVPHLWFDKQAKEAAEFYARAFPDTKVTTVTQLHGTPSGDVDVVSFEIMGQTFMSISAGPLFKPTPAISFMVNFESDRENARANLDAAWEALLEGGKVLMPLQEYPFSKRYGWVEDKYGFSWQIILTDPEGDERPLIVPSFLFVSDAGKKAEEATEFYLSVFKNTKRGGLMRYPAGTPNPEGSIMFTDFTLEGQWFAAMDGLASMHKFNFSEATSLMVYCDDQAEIDYYWEKLSAVPEAEQCGWLKDKFGVSWQIVPRGMDEMMSDPDEAKRDRITQAFLKMKKLDLAELEKAANS